MKKLTTLAALVMLNASLQAQGLEKDIKEHLDTNNLPKKEFLVAKGNILDSEGNVIFSETYDIKGNKVQCNYFTSPQAYDIGGLLYFPIDSNPFMYVYNNDIYLDKQKDGINGNEEKHIPKQIEEKARERKGDI